MIQETYGLCGNCRWWDHTHASLEGVDEKYGYCRKHYPVVFLREGRYYGGWPLTDQNDSCGEHRPKEEKG